ncbi:MAG TPA: hypothetical protein VF826_10720, partial [Chloroflexia bacterium]
MKKGTAMMQPGNLKVATRRRRAVLLLVGVLLSLLSVPWVFGSRPGEGGEARQTNVAAAAPCYAWSVSQVPALPGLDVTLMSASATSASDIWAVGWTGGAGDTRNLIMHWDGKEWKVVPAPNPNPGANYLESVVALAPDNAWAVGDSSSDQKLGAIILHWDGRAWTPVDMGFLEGIASPSLYSVSASSPTDLWAAGVMGGTRDSGALIVHGDGVNWRVHKTGISTSMAVNQGTIRDENILYSIRARAANDVWAVGAQVIPPSGPTNVRVREVQLHWDGQTWRDETLPVRNVLYLTEATDIGLAPNSTNRFVVGNINRQPGVLNYVGAKRERTGLEMRVLNNNYLTGVIALGETDAWAVGYGENRESIDLRPLIARTTDGSNWAVVGDAAFPDSGRLNDIAHIPGTAGDLVAAGSTNGAPLIMMHRDMCAPPPPPTATALVAPVTQVVPTPSAPATAPTSAPTPIPGEAQSSRTFPETGKAVKGIFLEYWDKHGGLPQQGFPISDMFTEVSTLDGKPYTVQYFERAVFEYHPENQPPFNVLLSQLGTFRYKQ